MLLHLSFPKERNGGFAWANFLYDYRLRLDTKSDHFHDQHKWQYKASELREVIDQGIIGDAAHHWQQEDWEDISWMIEEERKPVAGVNEGDIVSFVITTGGGRCGGEVFGVVHEAVKKPQHPERVTDLFFMDFKISH